MTAKHALAISTIQSIVVNQITDNFDLLSLSSAADLDPSIIEERARQIFEKHNNLVHKISLIQKAHTNITNAYSRGWIDYQFDDNHYDFLDALFIALFSDEYNKERLLELADPNFFKDYESEGEE